MLEISQALLVATTALITLALGAYVVAVFAAGLQKKTVARQTVLVGGAGQHDQDVAPGAATPAKSAPATGRGLTWFGSKFVQLALLSLTGSMIVRMFATGHPPFANHYEFAVSFAWGMILAQVYFEWRYRVRTLALVVLPVILGMLIYASTLSYEANPLMPALQNSPLLTVHVFTAALSYGAAVIAFGAAVMYLLAPHVKWQGWPKQEVLDELGYKAVIVTFPGKQLRQPGVHAGHLFCCQGKVFRHDVTCSAGTYSHCATIFIGPLNAVTLSTLPVYFSISTSVV